MSLRFTVHKLTMELQTPLLGTNPMDPHVFTTFIAETARKQLEKDAKKGLALADGTEATSDHVAAALAEEAAAIPDREERGWTTFAQDDDGPFLWAFAVKGFLKEAARTLKEWGKGARAVKQLRDKVARYSFVKPRKVRLPRIGLEMLDSEDRARVPTGYHLPVLERPLRAETPKGPRVALVRSDYIPAGATFSFELWVLHGGGLTTNLLRDVLEYAEFQGFGCWRGGGYGAATVKAWETIRQDVDEEAGASPQGVRARKADADDAEDAA